jgi:hypothetical protein
MVSWKGMREATDVAELPTAFTCHMFASLIALDEHETCKEN